MTANIRIRAEEPGDEEAIDTVNCSAFGSMDEANLVRLLRRYWPTYDRRYSVTAWDGDEMVGHALFTPADIRLMGETIPALAVAPVAVVPERQRQGIGGQMLCFGHELGRRGGFALAFLHGHPSYYPQYGYQPCHGFGKVTINADKLPAATRRFRRLPVRPADIPWLVRRHAVEWAEVDFAWLWGTGPGEWAIPCVNTMMWWTQDGRRAAYTAGGRMLLADDPDLAREVITTLRPAKLEHHPCGWLARNVIEPEWGAAEVKRSEAAMACELREGALGPYLEALESGRPPGFCLFPLPFMAC